MKKVIVIPARYGSSRFPGKPLSLLAGKHMVQHVMELSLKAASHDADTHVILTSEDERILDLAAPLGVMAVHTGDCPTGSDRVMLAVQQLPAKPDVIVSMQGDAPLTPPHFIQTLFEAFSKYPRTEVATVAARLTWEELDQLRTQKLDSPFSGTTVVRDKDGYGRWFSKTILPAVRKEDSLRKISDISPVIRHIGLYGYTYATLEQFLRWPEGYYEKLEGLEQLRFLENGVPMRVEMVDYQGCPAMSGVDTPADLTRADALLKAREQAL